MPQCITRITSYGVALCEGGVGLFRKFWRKFLAEAGRGGGHDTGVFPCSPTLPQICHRFAHFDFSQLKIVGGGVYRCLLPSGAAACVPIVLEFLILRILIVRVLRIVLPDFAVGPFRFCFFFGGFRSILLPFLLTE